MTTDKQSHNPGELSHHQPDQHPLDQGDVAGDVIVTGDISGSYIAIGRGAQVIVQRALTAVEEAQQRHQVETGILARALVDYVERLRTQIPQAEAAPMIGEPYKSLLPYRLADAPFFFGRNEAKTELSHTLLSQSRGRLTVLHSESGAGKTSLLQAGLAAQLLAWGHLPLYVRAWRQSPSQAIKQAIVPDLGQTPELAQLPLRPFLKRVTGVIGLATVVYILLDQFEEFFIRVPDEAARQDFIEELGECVDDETLRVRFVLSLRKDHFANLSDFRGRIPYIFANEYPLKFFTRSEAASAITAPASLVDLSYAPGVVEEILGQLQGSGQTVIMPAQLQLVCWALYQALGEEQQLITLDLLQQMGGVAGILRHYLRNVLSREIPPGQRQQAWHIIEALVRSDRTRDILTVAQLRREVGSDEQLQPILDALVASRLLRVLEAGSSQESAYELAHDYLVEQIELDPELLARKAAQELLDQETETWRRNPQLHIGEEKLKVIEAQRSRLHFSPEARELYELSQKARRRRRRIFFGLLGGVVLAVCLALILFQRWIVAQENLTVANRSLVTATSIIRSAQNAAVEAEQRRDVAQAAEAEAVAAEAAARAAGAEAIAAEATARLARQTAEAGRILAIEAEQTAVAAGYAAQTRQARAEEDAEAALASEATAQAAQAQAVSAQQAAQASQATAAAGQQAAIRAQQTAAARQAMAETAAAAAEAAAAQARQAQTAAEQAQQKAEQARQQAEDEARQARRERAQAEQAAQHAEATRVAVETLRDQAQRELQETQRITAIVRDTQDCTVGRNPEAITFDGLHIWVVSKIDNTITKLQATDCASLGTFPTGLSPSDVIYGGGYIWVTSLLDNTVQKINSADGSTVSSFIAGPPGSWPKTLLYDGAALWVASEVTNKIRKIDPNSGADLGTFDTGASPADLTYDGTYLWIANAQSNTVSRLEAATGAQAGVFPVDFNPMWITHAGGHIWVANQGDNSITKLRASDGALLATFNTGSFPDALAFDGNNIWVVNQNDNTLMRLQPETGEILSIIPTGKTPTAMLFDGANIWVAAEDDDRVQKIPVTINLTGQEPIALAYDGLYIWVANQADNSVSKMLASSGERVVTYGVGNRPVGLVSAGNHIWVAHQNGNNVAKLRVADGVNLGIFMAGNAPAALTYDGTSIWVANTGSNSVTRLRETDGAKTGTFPVGDRPVDILYDGQTIWVANAGDQSLQKLDTGGAVVATYPLGITPRSFIYASPYMWVAYTVDAAPSSPETRLRQIRAVDGVLISDTGTGVTGSPAIAPAAISYDSRYVWVSSPNTIAASIATRFQASNPANFTNFPVCEGASALLYTNAVWVACKDDGMIQKLPGDSALSGLEASSLTKHRTINMSLSAGDNDELFLPVIVK